MRKLCWIGGIAALAFSACRTAETPDQARTRMDQETASAKRAIETAHRGYERFTNEGKADSVAGLYAESGRSLQPNGPTLAGRDAIRTENATRAAVYDQKLTITSENIIANGPMAIDVGTFSVDVTPRRGAPTGAQSFSDRGKYMAHWHQVNGQWLIADLIWNSDLPSPSSPAPGQGR